MEEPPPFAAGFGDLLKIARKHQRLTQQQLAARLGVHANTISAWELGTYLPATRSLVLELARLVALDEPATLQLLEASLTARAPYWHVPLPRNLFFTGRAEILERLHTQLGPEQTAALTQSTALHGLGGVGKTQVAVEYAYRYALEYSAVFWLSTDTEEQTVSSLLRIAEVLQLPGRDDHNQQRVVAAVQHWLTTHRQWLLIWDNLEDLELLPRFLPPTMHAAVLLTTRAQALGTLARGIELMPLEPEEGKLLLLRRATVLEPEASLEALRPFAERMPSEFAAAEELVRRMGGLPLALDQAGAYIEETGCSLADYLQRYQHQRAHLLARRGGPGADHPHSVTATFVLASEQVERGQRAAADLLRVCAFLAADAIPEELFLIGARHLGPELAPLAGDPSRFDQAIAVLRNLALVQRQAETHTLSLHRLVQAVLRERMSEQEHARWLRRVLQALNAVFPTVTQEAWGQCERLLGHVLACVSLIQEEVESQELAALLRKAADYLRMRGQYAQAEAYYQRALPGGEQTPLATSPDQIQALNGLARLYVERGQYAQAEPLYQRALHLLEQALGSEHLDLAYPLDGLAYLYDMQGRYAQAEPLYQRALSIEEQVLGPEHPKVAASLTNLALFYVGQGKYPQAERLYQRALSIEERALGPEHPKVAYPLNGLALLYAEQGQDAQAESCYQRVLSIWEHAWGAEYPHLAYPLTNLADLYRTQGKDEPAEQLYQRAIRIREQALGPENPKVAAPLIGLARLYTVQRQDEPAEQLYQRAIRIQEQALGTEHPDLVASLNGLANLYARQGKHDQAEPLFQHALGISEQKLGPRHPETAQTLHDLALFQQHHGHLSEAISLTKRALEIRSQALGNAHPKTVATQALYTQLLREQGCTQEKAASGLSAEGLLVPLRKKRQRESASPFPHQKASHSIVEHDPLQEFLAACCELHPRAWCRIGDLWQAYQRWSAEQQERFPLARRAFAAQLKGHGCSVDRTSTARIWRGITLLTRDP